jgi:Xaa-Pro aminopeptidase
MVRYGEGWQIPVFSEEEGKRRWRLIREMMTAREIDCLVIAGHVGNYRASYADIRYVSNFINWYDDEYCVFPLEEDPTLYVWARQHEYWAKKVSWIPHVVTAAKHGGAGYVASAVNRIRELGLERGTIGLAQLRVMPTYFYMGITRELPNARFVDAGDIMRAARLIKSPEEIEMVRKAGECADIGYTAMRETARPGITEYDLIAEVERAMIKAGAECGSFTLFNTKQWPDGWGFPVNGSNRLLQKGDIILNEITPCFGGYFVQLCRPICLGKPPQDFLEMFEVYKGIYEMGREGYRSGNVLSEVDAKAEQFAKSKRPFSYASACFQMMDSITTNPPFMGTLKSGIVCVIHPWCHPSEADMNAGRGHLGHICGDTCISTEGAAECVSKIPNEIAVV